MSFGRVPFRSVHIPFRPRFRSFAARFVSNMSGEKRKASSPSQDQATLGDLTSRKAQHTDSTDTPGASTSKDASPSKSKLSASATEFKPSAPVAPSSAPKAATNSLFGPQLPSAWAVAGAHQSLLLGQFGDPTSSALQLLDQREQKDEPLVTFALLDLDWTVIKPKPNGTKDKRFPNPRDEYDFVFLYPNVARKVQEAHAKGHIIVICSNQLQKAPPAPRKGQVPRFEPDQMPNLQTWKRKVSHVIKGLGVPAYVMASLLKDEYRKPHAGMWHYLIDEVWAGEPAGSVLGPQGVQKLGKSKNQVALPSNAAAEVQSYFVGDLAGRIAHAGNGRAADFRDTDRKFALNAGLAFYTPEAYFLGHDLPQEEHLELRGFDARSAIENMDPEAETRLPEWIHAEGSTGEPTQLVIFVGAPGAGKSSYYRRVFGPRGYAYVNQDILGTRPKCIKETERLLSTRKSVVVDNTNRDKATRAFYTNIAKTMGIPCYCVHFTISLEQAWHQNVSRALEKGEVGIIPAIAYTSYRSAFQAPEQSEGFAAPPFEAPWIFVGDDKHKAHYSQWFSTMEEFLSRGGPK